MMSAFAEYWKENRNYFRPRGQRMIKMELRRKGLNSQVIDETVEDIDDKRPPIGRRCQQGPQPERLIFRYFAKDWAVISEKGIRLRGINNAVKRVWQERTENSGSVADCQKRSKPEIKYCCPRIQYR